MYAVPAGSAVIWRIACSAVAESKLAILSIGIHLGSTPISRAIISVVAALGMRGSMILEWEYAGPIFAPALSPQTLAASFCGISMYLYEGA